VGRRAPSLLGAWLVVHLLEGLGLLAVGIGGVLVMALLLPTVPAIVLEDLGPIAGVRRGARLARPRIGYVRGVALLTGILAWAGAATQDAGVGLGSLAAAGANCIPAALLFLGLGTLLFAVAPRQSAGAAMALVGASFLWELVGAVVGAPSWALALSPFHHVAAVPVARFDTTGAAIMLALGVGSAAAGLAVFTRRDLQTS
jgi:ABC-2 type transport system permease protein